MYINQIFELSMVLDHERFHKVFKCNILSEFLGHCSEETTRIYAYADTEMKREAINKATADIAMPEEKPIWDETDEETLRKLAGLR